MTIEVPPIVTMHDKVDSGVARSSSTRVQTVWASLTFQAFVNTLSRAVAKRGSMFLTCDFVSAIWGGKFTYNALLSTS